MSWSDILTAIDSIDNIAQSGSGLDAGVNILQAAAAVTTFGNLIATSPGTAIAINATSAVVSAQKILSDVQSGKGIQLGDVFGMLSGVAAVTAVVGFQISPLGRVANIVKGVSTLIASASLASKFFGSNVAIADDGNDSSSVNDEIIDRLKERFNLAEQQASPIILDLDGNGIDTVGFDAGVHFDHDGNGFAQLTGWVGANDGLLVWDRDGNGVIDSGGELFGDNTVLVNGLRAVNGFAALAEHDSGGNGVIDANDAVWSELRVWRDLSQDGVTQEGELVTLDQLGITSISLAYTNSSHVDGHGNAHKQVGSFTWADGTAGTATDLWFAVDNARTRELDLLEVPEDIAALPNLAGFGNVRSLHQAMVRDEGGQLRVLVEQIAADTDPDVRRQVMIEILYVWTGVSGIAAGSRGGSIDARKLAALEAFLGQSYLQNGVSPNPGPQAAILLEEVFSILAGQMYQGLMLQTHLRPILGAIELVWAEDAAALRFGLDGVVGLLAGEYQNHPANAGDLTRVLAGWLAKFGEEAGFDLGGFERALATVSSELLIAYFLGSRQAMEGTNGNDVLNGTTSDEVLWGGQGDDVLRGYGGNDILIGGRGNDTLYGGTGNDTYLYEAGDGHDTIVEQASEGNDVLRLGAEITVEGTELARQQSDLILRFSATDSVRIQNYFANNANGGRIETIEFADGTVWDYAAVAGQLVYRGTDAGEYLYGLNGVSNHLEGLGGNDTLYGASAADVLDGGDGNDVLYGYGGNDILIGGRGNDTLYGGTGNDTYLFGRGDGQDVIYDYDTTAGNTDRLIFGEDVAADQLWFSRSGSHLQVSVIGSTDRVTIDNWYAGTAYRVEEFHAGDGAILLHNQVEALVSAMAAFSPPAAGETSLSGQYREALDTVIAANWQ